MPRAAMYQLYMDFCQQACMEPINQATFGKAVRSSFEGLKTRRLGMRGHSKCDPNYSVYFHVFLCTCIGLHQVPLLRSVREEQLAVPRVAHRQPAPQQ